MQAGLLPLTHRSCSRAQAALEDALGRIGQLLPPNFSFAECITHAFLYHGTQHQAPLHSALVPDFSFQIAGSKLWRFVHPRHSPLMMAMPIPGLPGVWTSPRLLIEGSGVPYVEVVARAGDMMFFPEYWWHEVHNVGGDESFGLMCGLRLTPSPAALLREALLPSCLSGVDPVLGWHKLATIVSVLRNEQDFRRPEYQCGLYAPPKTPSGSA